MVCLNRIQIRWLDNLFYAKQGNSADKIMLKAGVCWFLIISVYTLYTVGDGTTSKLVYQLGRILCYWCWFSCQDMIVMVYKVSKVNYIFKFKLPCQSVTCHSAWYQHHTCQLCCFTIFPSYLKVFVFPEKPWFKKSALTDNSVIVCKFYHKHFLSNIKPYQ